MHQIFNKIEIENNRSIISCFNLGASYQFRFKVMNPKMSYKKQNVTWTCKNIQSWIKMSKFFLFYRNGKAIDNTAYGPLIDLPDFSYLGMELLVALAQS